MKTLRPYQQKIIDKCINFLSEPQQELIIKLHTGLGKSFVIPRLALVLKEKGYSALVLSDITQLINQIDEHFKNMQLNVSKIVSNEQNTTLGSITLSMEQTIYNRLESVNKVDNLIILYDESHKRRFGDRFTKIIECLEPVKLIGFTATPYDMHGVLMFDNIYEPISFYESEEQGYLTPIKYKIPAWIEKLDFESIDTGSNIDYSSDKINKLYNTKEFKQWFKEFYDSLEPKQTLIFTSNIEMAEWVGSLIDAETFHSKNNNQEVIDEFRNGRIRTIVGVTSLTTGFDAPNIERIINLRPTKSIPLFIQMVGRGSRLYDGKDKCEFIDITNCLLNFGFPEEFKGFRTKEEAKEFKAKSTLIEKYFEFNKHNNEMLILDKETINDFTNSLVLLKNKSLVKYSIDELKQAFIFAEEPRELVLIANEFHRRKYGWFLKTRTIEKMIYEMNKYANELDRFGKRKSVIKAYKTRIRNILNQGKKLSAMIYFPEWFYKQTMEKYKFNF